MYITAPAGLYQAFVTRQDVIDALDSDWVAGNSLDEWLDTQASLSPVVAFFVRERAGDTDQLLPVNVYHHTAGYKMPDDSGFAYQALGFGRQEAKEALAEVIRGFFPDAQDPEL